MANIGPKLVPWASAKPFMARETVYSAGFDRYSSGPM